MLSVQRLPSCMLGKGHEQHRIVVNKIVRGQKNRICTRNLVSVLSRRGLMYSRRNTNEGISTSVLEAATLDIWG
jgi:hypothetical protein